MPSRSARGLCAAVLAASALAAQASSPAAPERRDPTRADAPVPPLQTRSALETYRRHAEQPLGDWRAANDEVTRIGGWRTYLRQAQAPDAPPAPAPAPAGAPTEAKPAATGAAAPANPAASAPAAGPAPGHRHHGGHR